MQHPQFWRDRAEKARVCAERTKDRQMIGFWLLIAEGHERQAALLQQTLELERDGLANGPPKG
jgi:hypothetical protein